MNLALLILKLIFISSLLGVLHTYLFYPLLMYLLGFLIPDTRQKSQASSNLPRVDIIFAAYNEEAVIEQKLKSSFDTHYPLEQLRVLV